jgi:hypothetical protein
MILFVVMHGWNLDKCPLMVVSAIVKGANWLVRSRNFCTEKRYCSYHPIACFDAVYAHVCASKSKRQGRNRCDAERIMEHSPLFLLFMFQKAAHVGNKYV